MTDQTGDEALIAAAVEALRQAMVDRDGAVLDAICAEQLSYGHSQGSIDTKARFIADNTVGKTHWKWIELSGQTTALAEDVGLVRHILKAETEKEGKALSVHLGILLVWQKQAGRWKLLARQAHKF
jgi:ketosteroid isomerase-like protein